MLWHDYLNRHISAFTGYKPGRWNYTFYMIDRGAWADTFNRYALRWMIETIRKQGYSALHNKIAERREIKKRWRRNK